MPAAKWWGNLTTMSHRRSHVTGKGKGGHENKVIRLRKAPAKSRREVTDGGGAVAVWLLIIITALIAAAAIVN